MSREAHSANPAEMRVVAQSVASHFATTSGRVPSKCDRCGLPPNRWDEPCDANTREQLLGRYVLALLDEVDRLRASLRSLEGALTKEPESGSVSETREGET
jgi:hypothetical protein